MSNRLLSILAFLVIVAGSAFAQQLGGVRPHAGMLRYPDVSATQIVFMYANSIWVVPRDGGLASPVASPAGSPQMPRFSPDGKTVAFVGNYDGNQDIYTIPVDGGAPFRVTYHPANEFLCDWTPDGKLLFASNGHTGLARQQQLYIVSAKGGLPERIPVPYGTNGAISPDGKKLAYTLHTTDFRTWKRYRGGMATDIWMFDLKGHKSKKITDWEGTDTLPMWNGSKVYYLTDMGAEHRLNIWSYDTQNGRRQQITKLTEYDIKWPAIGPGPNGKGEIVFQYGSNLDLLDLDSGKVRTVDVRIPGDRSMPRARTIDASRYITGWSISPSGKRAAIEARGDIWTAPAKEGSPRNLTRTSGAAERDPAWSPDGKSIAYFSDATGEYELYIAPADGKEPAKQITKDGHAFRFQPQWSPNSKYILFRDKTGALFILTVDSGNIKLIDKDPVSYNQPASWSHDSRWVAYAKQNAIKRIGAVWIYNVETGDKRQATSGMFADGDPVFDRRGDYLYFVSSRAFQPKYEDLGTTWIYDNTDVLMAVPLRTDIKYPYAPESDEEPVKPTSPVANVLDSRVRGNDDRANVALVAQPQQARVTQDTAAAQADEVSGIWKGTASGEMLPGGSIQITLTLKLGAGNSVSGTMDTPIGGGGVSGSYNPGAAEVNLTADIGGGPHVVFKLKLAGGAMTGTADAQGASFQIKLQRQGGGPASGQAGAGGRPGGDDGRPRERVTIDFEGFEQRAIQLPIRRGRFGGLSVNDRNQLVFVRNGNGLDEPSAIKLFDIKDEKRDEKTVAQGATSYDLSADGKKLLVIRGGSAQIMDAAAGASGSAVITAGMLVTIEPKEEWKQLFADSWRMYRDFFYDPNMHGVDWPKVRQQYSRMLDDAANRDDVSYIISEMISELNVGHAYYNPAPPAEGPTAPSVSVGLLGAEFALENGAFRISHIHRAAPWDSDTRGPLDQPGLKVKEGDYLLAVNGTPLDTSKDPYAAFQGMADQVVTLTVSDKPKIDSSAREVIIKPMATDQGIRYREWVEHNRAYVEKQTGGRVGYIHVPSTGIDGQTELFRQLLGQRDRDALIIDERWNSGGQIPTRFVELLNRPVTNYWARRDHADWTWPWDAQHGPKVMLINGLAGSGGDAFPYYFKQAGLGKLIGTRTWGGLVGLSGNPALIDGASVSVPTFAFYAKEGHWAIEGHGVDPDIEVTDDPALMTNGGDPQLDAGIKQAMEELKRNPYVAPKRPAYPNRSGIGSDPRDR